jgi:hypothetical protein
MNVQLARSTPMLLAIVLLVSLPGAARAQNALIIQDQNPWGYSYWFDRLDSVGVPYTTATSADIPTVDLTVYDLVIIPSQQQTAFNTTFDANVGRFEDYLAQGGRLILMLATYTSYTAITTLPYGAWHDHSGSTLSYSQTNLDPTHPVMNGFAVSLSSLNSHGRLSGYGTADELTENSDGYITSYFAGVGPGAMYVATIVLEWDGSGQYGDIGSNAIDHLLNGYCADGDGDGYLTPACGGGDCDDTDSAVNPGMTETACTGVDDDCDGLLHAEEVDDDLDGSTECDGDCDDADSAVFPGAVEAACNYTDDDCDGAQHTDDVDDDGDGYDECSGDCDDTDPFVSPGDAEVCNEVDDDCDGAVDEDFDLDLDGYTTCADDCDDTDAAVNPAAIEIACDAIDNDCDGAQHPDDVDDDGDGFDECSGDCEDTIAAVYPGSPEVECNGLDDDCDPATEDAPDVDGDGYAWCSDCDDTNALIYPGAVESCDGLDNDCSGSVPADEMDADADGSMICEGDCDDADPTLDTHDVDGDGYTSCDGDCNDYDATVIPVDGDGDGFDPCDGDCDDSDADIHPDAEEICDGLDNDCDPTTDEMQDGDGDGFTICTGDCDDDDDQIHPDAIEIMDDGLDNDCDGLIDMDDPGDDDTGDDDTGDDDTGDDDTGDDDTGDDDTGDDDTGDDDTTPTTDDDLVGPSGCDCRFARAPSGGLGWAALCLVVLAGMRRRFSRKHPPGTPGPP